MISDPSILYDVFIIAGAIQGVFLAIVLISRRAGNRKANLFLCLLLVAFALSICHVELVDLFRAPLPSPSRIGDPLQLLFGPLFYFYMKRLTDPSFKISWKQIPHVVPAALLTLLFIFFQEIAVLIDNNLRALNIVLWLAIVAQMVAYLIVIIQNLVRYGKSIKNDFSNIDKINLKWIRYLVVCFVVFYALYLALAPIIVHYADPFRHFNKVVMLMLSLLIYGIGYRGLTQPEIFGGRQTRPEPEAKGGKYLKSSIDEAALSRDFTRLKKAMDDKQLYKNIDLTLSDLAAKLGTTNHRLSQVINKGTRGNFYDFINTYRVEEVKKLLADPANLDRYTILGLAHDSGFSSKATFNRFFKRVTGLTPSDFIRRR